MDNVLTAERPRADVRSSRPTTSDWLVPAALIALSLVPAVAGSARVAELAAGATVTVENARFVASPLPVILHIVGALLYSLPGAFQFSAGVRRRNRRLHRITGWIALPAGFIVALSGLWMTQFYPSVGFDGVAVYIMRLLTGSAMAVSLGLGLAAMRRRDFAGHEAWMIRAYAIGLGAGTQVLTHIPLFLFPDMQGELARAICMGAGWGINIAVAEWVILRARQRRGV